MGSSEEALFDAERNQRALKERVKELTCLYGIAQVADRKEASLEEVLSGIVSLIPPAMQFPEITSASILLDGRRHETPRRGPDEAVLASSIAVEGAPRGRLEVIYSSPPTSAGEDPFLPEERSLVGEIARQVGLIVGRREANEQRAALEQQLRHADRLATVGRLAAGVAHELNEPLGAILGFAQLTRKSFGLPDQTGRDLDKIVKASLHARGIVQKLLIFARESPSKRAPVQLNAVLKDSLFLLSARCRKCGVKVDLRLAEDLPPIFADPGLMQQVVVNLASNAIQAMPQGGTLTVATARGDLGVVLRVEDTGEGMGEEVLRHIFTPFFTTKEVGQGTGLGLAVVHGIVSGHGGTIKVDSAPGEGARFEVALPLASSEPLQLEAP